jgi:hypothetical protein
MIVAASQHGTASTSALLDKILIAKNMARDGALPFVSLRLNRAQRNRGTMPLKITQLGKTL